MTARVVGHGIPVDGSRPESASTAHASATVSALLRSICGRLGSQPGLDGGRRADHAEDRRGRRNGKQAGGLGLPARLKHRDAAAAQIIIEAAGCQGSDRRRLDERSLHDTEADARAVVPAALLAFLCAEHAEPVVDPIGRIGAAGSQGEDPPRGRLDPAVCAVGPRPAVGRGSRSIDVVCPTDPFQMIEGSIPGTHRRVMQGRRRPCHPTERALLASRRTRRFAVPREATPRRPRPRAPRRP